MKNSAGVKLLSILPIIFLVGFGCKYLQTDQFTKNRGGQSTQNTETQTKISKEVLIERLEKKGVKLSPVETNLKPNPLTLHLKFKNYSFTLNNEQVSDFKALTEKLREIFRAREENGVFIEGTNEVYKKITLPMYDSDIKAYNENDLSAEFVEKLVDNLLKEGFDQIYLDINESNLAAIPQIIDRQNDNSTPANRKSTFPKTISGGVVNGKATNLVKPQYPAAARAARASGAVNVQVLINEKGDVVSAIAVSGHALLRASAEQAARSSEFSPTLLGGQPVKVSGVIVYNFTLED